MINSQSYLLRYSSNFVNKLIAIQKKDQSQLSILFEDILPDLCRYPLQGRLLLNREGSSQESEELRWALAKKFVNHELRERYIDDWLIVYLHHAPYIYLLSLIAINKVFQDPQVEWIDIA